MSRTPNRTPYGKLMYEKRKEERRKKKKGFASPKARSGGICGAKKKHGQGFCQLPAGHRTDHVGIGRCYHHGGGLPSHQKSAAKEYAKMMGAPVEMNPLDAIIWCIQITAGEVKWLSERMAELEETEWLEHTMVGKQLHIYAKERQSRVRDLAKYSQIAVSLGLAERAIRLAEQYGEAIARLLNGVLDELDLTKEQRERVPVIVRKHLILLEGGRPVQPVEIEKTLKELPAA